MRLHRLRVLDFAGIQEVDVEFGPGLNVLYGPNDLGKSTLAAAIRLALLLPHTSTHIEDYVPWSGGRDPVIEMTFETAPQRIWRVRKEFRRGGTALLQESRNGTDFDDVERARRVDAKLRELLQWGIPEPGGAGGSKGLPASFLATVLLSTQADVSQVLDDSLKNDQTVSGRERIAAALQAVAQDPLFVALLRTTQARRDEAYTDKGAKKTAKGSVFKAAADRVNRVREEKDALQKVVDDSEGIETQLRELIAARGRREFAVAAASEALATLERLAAEAAERAAAALPVRLAGEEVVRIQRIAADVEAAKRRAGELARTVTGMDARLEAAQLRHSGAGTALEAAEAAERAAGPDAAVSDVVRRQRLELRRAAAEQAARVAQQQIDGAVDAQASIDRAIAAESAHHAHRSEVDGARHGLADAAAAGQAIDDQLRQLERLERALDVRSADAQEAVARAAVDNDIALRARLQTETDHCEALMARRASITVPAAAALPAMRRLEMELAAARGALSVGLVVTVTSAIPIELHVRRDGATATSEPSMTPIDIDADTEVDIDIAGVAAVRVRGGRRATQKMTASLADRWALEVVPHLAAARVTDLEGLSARVTEAQGLDASLTSKAAGRESLSRDIATLSDAAPALRRATDRANSCRAAIEGVPLETLVAELAKLGADPASALRQRRQQLAGDLEAARANASRAGSAHVLAEERARQSQSTLETVRAGRNAALMAHPDGVETMLTAARAALATAAGERLQVQGELTTLTATVAAEQARIEAALRGARADLEQARAAVDAAQAERTRTIAEHAVQVGRLAALQQQHDAEDLAAAAARFAAATARHAALPVPSRLVSEDEVATARIVTTRTKADLETIEREIQRTHGALGQVGGAVARERLRDTIEAFELAETHEREIETDYEAWLLLLEQMKQADAAQASNLGQTLAPAIAGRFEALTERRYENVRLTAQLATEGVVVDGAVRPTERLSIGTREQLSTLYRLAMAEYLGTTVVLDDQLVQSDDTRMDWFRTMLAEKARSFQIVVFTCRPGDYLAAGAMATRGKALHRDSDAGFVRAIDLDRAMRRKPGGSRSDSPL